VRARVYLEGGPLIGQWTARDHCDSSVVIVGRDKAGELFSERFLTTPMAAQAIEGLDQMLGLYGYEPERDAMTWRPLQG